MKYRAVYCKNIIGEDSNSLELIRSVKKTIPVLEYKILILNDRDEKVFNSKFYSTLIKWADQQYRQDNQYSFILKPELSDMNDNDESEFYL